MILCYYFVMEAREFMCFIDVFAFGCFVLSLVRVVRLPVNGTVWLRELLILRGFIDGCVHVCCMTFCCGVLLSVDLDCLGAYCTLLCLR